MATWKLELQAARCPLCGSEPKPRASKAGDWMERGQKIIEALAFHDGFDVSDLTGPRRWTHLTQPRAKIIDRLRLEGYSLKEIGYLFGGRNHSTIISYLKKSNPYRKKLKVT